MKLKTKLNYEPTDTYYTAVGYEKKKFNGILNVSKVGKFILELMENDISKDEIVKAMTDKYDVDSERAREGLEKFLKEIEPAGIIVFGEDDK